VTTDAPVIKELYIPGIPDEFSQPVEAPAEQPEKEPAEVPA
jgi:hypothetical protein